MSVRQVGWIIMLGMLPWKHAVVPPAAKAVGWQESAVDTEKWQAEAFQVARQELVDRLVQELDELIPGSYADRPDQMQRLKTLAEFFLDSNSVQVTEMMDELANADDRLPPRDLLLAGLSYAINNSNQGKTLLERAAIQHPEHPSIALAFARLALVQGRLYDALVLAENARMLSQKALLDDETKQHYEIEATDSITIIELRRGNLQAASGWSQQWEILDPQSDKMLLASAEIQFLMEKSDQAIEYLNRRSSEKQLELPTPLVLANWFQAKGDYTNYGKWMQAAYEKHPDNSLTQLQYAVFLLRQEEFDQAKTVISQYETEHGESIQSMLVLGRIAFSEQDYPAAEKLFEQVFQRQPNNFEHSYLYALVLLESPDEEKRQQAIPLAQRSYQLFSNNQLAIATLGWALLRTGSQEPGAQLLEQAAQAGEMLPDTAYFLAKLKESEGRKIQARIILDPFLQTPEIFLYRSRAKQLIENLSDDEPLPTPSVTPNSPPAP